jgi:hypothetical protein
MLALTIRRLKPKLALVGLPLPEAQSVSRRVPFLESRPVVSTNTWTNSTQNSRPSHNKNLLLYEEWKRRNNIIEALHKECQFKEGDVCRPVDDKRYTKDGLYKVMSIDKNFHEYKGTEEDENAVDWPKGDNPLIVTAWQIDADKVVNCTTNFLMKFEPADEEVITHEC